MNQTKHTPGPWTARYGNRHEVVKKVIDENDGREISVFIADCDVNRGEVDKANARLIAAAPKLLEHSKYLLEELRVWFTPIGKNGVPNYPSSITFAVAGLQTIVNDAEGGDA